ncbi:MAG: exodeoxyribonuclease VII small subunit [Dehalococcoidia bacterium]|nr:exodeoxyribonuclease VII small subunit [Dehalococcoidia bacterium]
MATNEPPQTAGQSELALEGHSFEVLYQRLEAVAQRLEAGDLTLEESVRLYEEGMQLAEQCQALLGDVEQRIEVLRQRANGN